ncbi:salivary gland secretion 1 [Rhodotorula toruloides]|uniref:Salivary gland secretion 1 n=1 Tax=Rhodotorula toruloides TaxID=5286 RepID=A0A511KBC5_RHOTO|nr:salivary gland secretion 1 [Rhodotorula toruloides]
MIPLPDSPQLAPADETPAQTETKRLGACLVCGEETTKLCSKCLGAGHELFFCSPGHQKLIWRDHHRVCGRSLVPDSRAWLSKQEAFEAVASMYVPRRLNNGRVTSMLDYLRHPGLQHIYRLTEGHEHPYDPYASNAALNDIRMFELRRDCGLCTPMNKVWHPGMNHRLVIFVSLLRQFRAGNPSITLEFCQNAYKQIEIYLASPAAKMLHSERQVFLEGLHAYIDPGTLVIRLPLCDYTADGHMTDAFKECFGRYRRAVQAK